MKQLATSLLAAAALLTACSGSDHETEDSGEAVASSSTMTTDTANEPIPTLVSPVSPIEAPPPKEEELTLTDVEDATED